MTYDWTVWYESVTPFDLGCRWGLIQLAVLGSSSRLVFCKLRPEHQMMMITMKLILITMTRDSLTQSLQGHLLPEPQLLHLACLR